MIKICDIEVKKEQSFWLKLDPKGELHVKIDLNRPMDPKAEIDIRFRINRKILTGPPARNRIRLTDKSWNRTRLTGKKRTLYPVHPVLVNRKTGCPSPLKRYSK